MNIYNYCKAKMRIKLLFCKKCEVLLQIPTTKVYITSVLKATSVLCNLIQLWKENKFQNEIAKISKMLLQCQDYYLKL